MLFRGCLTFIVLYASLSFADTSMKPERGHWWGFTYELPSDEEVKEEELTDEEKYNLPPLPPIQQLIEMHPQDLRKMEKEYLDQAVWKRDEESVKEYYTLVKAFRMKSRGFAAAHNYITMTNPSLSMNDVEPTTPRGITAKKALSLNDLKTTLADQRHNFGLIIFESQFCKFCDAMKPLYRAYQNRHGWDITYIDVDASPDLVTEFDIKSTPTVVMVKANSDKSLIVSNGVTTLPNLETNIYRSTRLLNGEINLQQFLTMEHQRGSSIDPVVRN
jgi:conjugal transfer pilus assembly protein TraF